MDALIANLHQIIRWPKPCEFEEFASEFEKVGRFFPNVIGAIDGLHLEIELTEERRFEPSFINYKQFHSLHLQVSLNGLWKKTIIYIWDVLILVFRVQIHGALIIFLIPIRWKNLLGEIQPKFTERRTPLFDKISHIHIPSLIFRQLQHTT